MRAARISRLVSRAGRRGGRRREARGGPRAARGKDRVQVPARACDRCPGASDLTTAQGFEDLLLTLQRTPLRPRLLADGCVWLPQPEEQAHQGARHAGVGGQPTAPGDPPPRLGDPLAAPGRPRRRHRAAALLPAGAGRCT